MKKQKSVNEDWLKLYDECLEIISPERTEELTEQAVLAAWEIEEKNRGVIAYGWSGGKDSVVLASLLHKAGLSDLPCFVSIHNNEYPAMERWMRQNAPATAEFVPCKKFSLAFINENPEYLFPPREFVKVRYEYSREWRPQEKEFCQKHGYKAVFAGRRREDGNFCGKQLPNGACLSENKDVASYNLFATWNHAETFAYIRRNNLELAPIYSFPNGFIYGTHSWTERDRIGGEFGDKDANFDELWQIDKTIVIEAAKELDAAKEYLKRRGYYED